MLKIPELAMNPNRKVTTKCYGEMQEWDDREQAEDYFFDAMSATDGAERDHYTGIYIQLIHGLDFCTDEEELDE